MRAQDQALLTFARQVGLLDPTCEARAASALQSGGAGALVRERVLAAEAVSGLLRELATCRFGCDRCRTSWDHAGLAGLDELACPACRRPLTIARPPSSRITGAHRVSGAHEAVRPSDAYPVAQPPSRASGAYAALRPSGGYPVAQPPSRPSGAYEALRPSSGYPAAQPPSRPSGAHPVVRPTGSYPAARPSDRAPASGGVRRVGGYTLTRELGRGSNGVVWLAVRDGDQKKVALKHLTRAAAADPTTVERFRREGAVTSRLEHPGIVPVLDVGVEGGAPFLVMAYCPGPTLQERLRQGPLPPAQAAGLVWTLAGAVAHAHAAHVLHRDLKPANVILSTDEDGPAPTDATPGAARITDFGLALDLDVRGSLTQSSDLVGTPYYMAPERFRGEGRDDPRVDVYALGVILYECLTGRRPYEAATAAELVRKVEGAPPPPPQAVNPAVPAALGAVCLRAMAPAPSRRHASADELAADLAPFVHAERGRAPQHAAPATAPDARSPARAGRAVEALALALLVGGLLACAAAAWWGFVGGVPAPGAGELQGR